MEQIISQRNILLTTIGQIPPVSFTIANNMLNPSIRATDLRISPQETIITIWNSKNLKNGSFGVKHPERCSYTIPKNTFEDKWGRVAKAWANKVLSKTKKCV